MDSPASRWVFFSVVAVLLGAHLVQAVLFVAIGQPPLTTDALNYWRLGKLAARGDLLMRPNPADNLDIANEKVIRPPLQPWSLALAQVLFGRYALLTVVCLQQIEIIVTALLAAWACWRLTRSRFAVCLALALSFFCISRHYFALHLLSDNLLCLLVTILLVVLIDWMQRPSLWLACGIGIIIGLAALTKPVAQLLWLPVGLSMVFRLWQLQATGSALKHGACMLAMAALLWAPWYARNQECYGQFFFVQFRGRSLWCSCFGKPEGDLIAGLHLPQGPKFQALRAKVHEAAIDYRDLWAVSLTLQQNGCSPLQADKMMWEACLEAIREQPLRFIVSRGVAFAWYHVMAHHIPVWRYDAPLPADPSVAQSGVTFDNQKVWYWPSLARLHDLFRKCCWHPSRILYLCASLMAYAACASLLWQRRWRAYGLAFGLLLVYFAAGVACMSQPEYRMRMILEPLMIVAVSVAFTILVWGQSGSYSSDGSS